MERVFYRRLVATTFLIGVIALCMGCRGEQKEEKEIILGTGVVADAELNALSRGVFRAITKRVPELRISVRENPGGSTEAIENISRYDLCGLSLDRAAQAYYGFYGWEGRARPQLRLLWVIGRLPISFIAATDTGIDSIYELDGKAVGISEQGSMTELKAVSLLKVLGIKPDWHRSSWEVQLDLYLKGKLVGLVKEGAPDAALAECAERRPLTVLDISEKDLARANNHYNGTGLIFPMCLLRPGVYPGQEKILTTCGLMFGYFTRTDLSAEVAYKLLGAVYAELWDLAKCYKPMSLDMIGFPKLTMEQGPFPLHPGAVKLYQGMKLEPPDHLIPPELR